MNELDYQNFFDVIYRSIVKFIELMKEIVWFLNEPILSLVTTVDQPYSWPSSLNPIDYIVALLDNFIILIAKAINFIPEFIFRTVLGMNYNTSLMHLAFGNLIFVIVGWTILKSFFN